MRYFLLEGTQPVPVTDLLTWGRWFETAYRHVRDTWVLSRTGGPSVRVSTVFLGIAHRLSRDGPPLPFETMCFGPDPWDDWRQRYATWSEADAGHRACCAMVRVWFDEQEAP